MLSRVAVVAGAVDMAAAGAVVTVAAAVVATAVVGSPVDMVAGLAAAVCVAVGLEVVPSGVVLLAVSAAGLGGSAEPRLAAVSAELDLTASAAEAAVSRAFAGGAFPSRPVWVLEAGATTILALNGPVITGSTSVTERGSLSAADVKAVGAFRDGLREHEGSDVDPRREKRFGRYVASTQTSDSRARSQRG
jgi:hypothetical protein